VAKLINTKRNSGFRFALSVVQNVTIYYLRSNSRLSLWPYTVIILTDPCVIVSR